MYFAIGLDRICGKYIDYLPHICGDYVSFLPQLGLGGDATLYKVVVRIDILLSRCLKLAFYEL
jgi:hypothetical protein